MNILVKRKKASAMGNVARKSEMASRLGRAMGGDLEGQNALITLLRTINVKMRWVRYKPENLADWKFTYDLGVTGTYIAVTPEGTEEQVHVYYEEKNDMYYFSVLVKREEGSYNVIPDWHVNACKNLAREGYEYTKAFSDVLFEVGSEIIASIRNEEKVWRK